MIKNYINILRPINLLIVGFSQWIIYAIFVIPLFEMYDITRVLHGHLIPLFVLDTILIAAAGYVINDVMDYAADIINKPQAMYIGNGNISIRNAKILYRTLVSIGAIIAVYIALRIHKPWLFCIYPIATALLYFYSKKWKYTSLSGNIVVAIFCAFVPAIIWYAESDGFDILFNKNRQYILLYAEYILFGFLTTLVREIIKDIEDIEGDQLVGAKTFPITAGIERAKTLALFTHLLLISSYGLWILAMYRLEAYWSLGILVIALLLPSLLLIRKIITATQQLNFHKISTFLKRLMVIALVLFIITLLEV